MTPYASTPAAVGRGRRLRATLWEFNDGRDGREGRVVTRQYTTAGVFPAVLIVRDASGAEARIEKEVRISEASGGPGGPGPGPGPTTTVPGRADLQVTGLSNPSPRRNVECELHGRAIATRGRTLNPSCDPRHLFQRCRRGRSAYSGLRLGLRDFERLGVAHSELRHRLARARRLPAPKSSTVRFPSSDTYSVSATIFGGASDPNSSNDSRSVSSRVGLMETDAVESSFLSEILSEGATPVQASLEIQRQRHSGRAGRWPEPRPRDAATGNELGLAPRGGARSRGRSLEDRLFRDGELRSREHPDRFRQCHIDVPERRYFPSRGK